eukprot:Seg939.3 transcript_id=Seg939.3/GoldUCD/mRNA.D3Y31 product=Tenascin-R protein_id=Seg939.3/GoldUCD/D3Y31
MKTVKMKLSSSFLMECLHASEPIRTTVVDTPYRDENLEKVQLLFQSFIFCCIGIIIARGRPSKIISDNGSTFIAASKWIKKVRRSEKIQEYLAQHGMIWQFNLSRASWWGGMFERMVSIVKAAMYKVIGAAKLSFKEMQEVLLDIQIVLNNRPLTYFWPSCNEAFKTSPNKSGIFSVQIPGVIICKSSVYCDMAMDNKAWIVIQRHLSNETSFDRVWEDYKFGFGDLKGNFWLGLEKMHKLTNTRQTTLRFDLKHSDGSQGYAEYDNFKVADESQNYKLGLGAYDGNIGDSMRLNDGYPFTTKDRDNDQNSETNCAVEYSSGWWHFRCFEANVNNPYPEDKLDPSYYMSWWKWKESFAGITFSEMKIRYAD